MPLIACLQYQRHTPRRFYGGASCVEDLASNTCIQATGGLLQSESSVPENVIGVDDTTGGGLDKRSCIPHGPSAARQDSFWQLSAAYMPKRVLYRGTQGCLALGYRSEHFRLAAQVVFNGVDHVHLQACKDHHLSED